MSETYMQKRYRTDKDFHDQQIKSATDWTKKHRGYVNFVNRIRYAQRTPKQIAERIAYLKILRSK